VEDTVQMCLAVDDPALVQPFLLGMLGWMTMTSDTKSLRA